MKKTLGAMCAATLLGSLAAAAPGTTATAAGPKDVTIKPQALDRGADVAIAHLEGRRVVEGDVSLRVRGKQRFLLGASGEGYVVQVLRGGKYQVVRVEPGRAQQTLVESAPGQAVLSDDGETIAVIDKVARHTSIDVRSAVDGSELASRGGFRGYPTILGADTDHVLVASFEEGARDWAWRTDTISTVTKKSAYEADLSNDRLAYFTRDPYNGGCSVVTTISRPRTTLWRSCDEAVLDFSTDGQRVVTTDKLADGLGPSGVWGRTVQGRKLASYTAPIYFGRIAWESPTDLLLDTYGKKKGATVRCSEGDCERASDLSPTPVF